MAGYHGFKVALSVAIFVIAVCAIPIFNKYVFIGLPSSGGGQPVTFPFPAATSFMQVSFVAFALALANICQRLLIRGEGGSWLLGSHLGYKLRVMAPLGLCLGLSSGMKNLSLSLVPTGVFVLLSSTELAWTVLLARLINREKLSAVDVLSALLATAGSLLIGLRAGQTLEAPVLPIIANIASPAMTALTTSMVVACSREMMRPDNPLGGRVSPAEFTCLKMLLSLPVPMLLSLALEGGTMGLVGGREAWWAALRGLPAANLVFLLGTGCCILTFNINLTCLAGLTSAATVGIVSGLVVAPQWLLNVALGQGDTSLQSITGAALVATGSAAYAIARSLRPKPAASASSIGRGLLAPAHEAGPPGRTPPLLKVTQESK